MTVLAPDAPRRRNRKEPPATAMCLANLRRGPLKRHQTVPGRPFSHYTAGRRLFSPETVNFLIASGLAERRGDEVHATEAAHA